MDANGTVIKKAENETTCCAKHEVMKYITNAPGYEFTLSENRKKINSTWEFPEVGFTSRLCAYDYPTNFPKLYDSDGITNQTIFR